MTTKTLSLRRIKAWGACDGQYQQIKDRYPKGVPLTIEAALDLHDAGIDVLFGALRLLTDDERIEVLLFTLRQRQPHVVALLRAADHETHATAIAACRFETVEDATVAAPVLEAAARAASRDASRDARRDASWAASWDASRAASRDASRAARRAASWAASWAASRAASRDASRAARRAASWAASWDAATREQIVWVAERIAKRSGEPAQREVQA